MSQSKCEEIFFISFKLFTYLFTYSANINWMHTICQTLWSTMSMLKNKKYMISNLTELKLEDLVKH